MAVTARQGIGLIQKLNTAWLLWLGIKIVLKGQLTVGVLVAFNILTSHVTQPILRLVQIWQDIQHTMITLSRIGDILDTESEAGRSGVTYLPTVKEKKAFQYVSLCYKDDRKEVLSNLSFTIQAGAIIDIIRPSCSGKSTLTRLLQYLYRPQKGSILLDGMDIAILNTNALHHSMGIVLQNSILFVGSILDNITLCVPQAT